MSYQLFQRLAAPWILRRDVEGGESNHRNDRGGATNHGITIGFLELLPDGDDDSFLDGDINRDGVVNIDDIRALDDDSSADLYYRYIWTPSRCGALPPAMALCLFDGLVNHKPGPAKRLLQQGLGVKADGIIGPRTRQAAEFADTRLFLFDYLSYRAVFYKDIVTADSSQAVFLRGWFARLFRLHDYILEHTS